MLQKCKKTVKKLSKKCKHPVIVFVNIICYTLNKYSESYI